MKKVLFALVVLAVFTASGYAQQPSIQWELVNPFPFIHDRDKIDELRAVYDALPSADGKLKRDSSGLERALQKIADKRIKDKRDTGANCSDPDKYEPVCRTPYAGWFATVAREHYEATCWDPKNRRYRNDGPCVNFINPREQRVRAWVTAPVTRWLKGRDPFEHEPCDPKYGRANCIEFDIPFDLETGKSEEWTISAELADRSVTHPEVVQPANRLVVGLGDSFAAGEGNPDIPAKFTQGRTDVDFLYRFKVRRNPQKDKEGSAGWLDERCHRSMYSYQFKTALRMALENPREAVTFVSFSCSGAVTSEIIEKRQKPREVNRNRERKGEFARLKPQLVALQETLGMNAGPGGPRAIDYLLLSTGGNDIGFAKYVSYIINTGFVKWIYAKKPEKDKTKATIEETLFTGKKGVKGNYFQLQHAIFSKEKAPKDGQPVTPIKIRDCPNERGGCSRILLTVYPSPLQEGDDPEKICRADKHEFNIPFKKDDDRARRIGIANEFLIQPLQQLQQDVVKDDRLGWTVVTGHLKAFLDHGFCAQGGASESGNAEEFVMPKRDNHMWQKFDPWNYRVYEARERWIKLPVDSKLSTDQTHLFRSFSFDLFFEDDRANIMHPTAEGLARMADANFDAISGLESARDKKEEVKSSL